MEHVTLNHEYSRGLPKGPVSRAQLDQVPIMPGDLLMESHRKEILSRYKEDDAVMNGFNNIAFLKRVTHGRLSGNQGSLPSTTSSSTSRLSAAGQSKVWEFDDRRAAQAILPFLYLGPAPVAKDEKFLRDEGITFVILVRDLRQEVSKMLAPRTAQNMGLDTHIIEVRNDRLVSAFPIIIDMINKHLSARFDAQEKANEAKLLNREQADTDLPGKVLVYDLTGNEAAAAMCCAYIMAMFTTSAGEAVFAVQGRRFSINTQDCQRHISRYHDIILAKRDTNKFLMESIPAPASSLDACPTRGRKRELEDAIDVLENFSMQDQNGDRLPGNASALDVPHVGDSRSSSARRISAPFVDR